MREPSVLSIVEKLETLLKMSSPKAKIRSWWYDRGGLCNHSDFFRKTSKQSGSKQMLNWQGSRFLFQENFMVTMKHQDPVPAPSPHTCFGFLPSSLWASMTPFGCCWAELRPKWLCYSLRKEVWAHLGHCSACPVSRFGARIHSGTVWAIEILQSPSPG